MLEPVTTRADRGRGGRHGHRPRDRPHGPRDRSQSGEAGRLRARARRRRRSAWRSRAPPRRSSLRVGSKNPTGVWVYAREGGKPAVMTLSESVARDTARPVADFRDAALIAFDRRNLTRPRPRRRRRSDQARRRRAGQVAHRQAARAPRRRGHDRRLPREARRRQGDRVRGRRAEVPRPLRARQAGPRHAVARPGQGPLVPGPAGRAARSPEKKGVYVKRDGEPGVLLTAEAVWTTFPKTVARAARQDRRHLRLRQAHQGRARARARRRHAREGRHRLEAHRARRRSRPTRPR